MIPLAVADLGHLPRIALDAIEREASLQTRVDRKYVVTVGGLAEALDLLAESLRILDIAGEHVFGYRSTYFDTPDLVTYHAAATDRKPRFKVRTRRYESTGTCWLEVKLSDRRGLTVKHRIEHDHELHLDADAWAFLSGFEDVRPHLARLEPSIATCYERTTLLCGDQRITIDAGIECGRPDGTAVATLGQYLVVETKSANDRPGPVDRALWRVGSRPVRISKYAVGIAVANPHLHANRWCRVLRRYVQPAEAGPALVDWPDPLEQPCVLDV